MAKPKLIMLRGLPASGKSTWAKDFIKRTPLSSRVNKDDLRAMLHDSIYSRGNERQVIAVRDGIVISALQQGRTIVVDDTNFNPVHEQTLRKYAAACEADFEVKDFDVELDEAIRRDLKRPVSVGAKVITKMYNDYVRKKPEQPAHIPGGVNAIICDIDGTLAHMAGRSPFEWDKVGSDTLDENVADIVNMYAKKGYTIFMLSGRDSVCRPQTEEWLKKHDVSYDYLFMRPQDDTRKDSIVKKELYNKHIAGNYNVAFVLDDRNQVVDMWRNDIGLKVLQVAEGDF